MRILILGAGGTGGYFGGRLAQSGADVTFLVRPARAAQLRADGLRIESPLGDAVFPVACATADELPALAQARPFDLVLLSCKAYDLDSSIAAIAPAVGAGTAVLPILNGLLHYPVLDACFGAAKVVGGLCYISATKAEDGRVRHLGGPAWITFGERDGRDSERTRALAALFDAAGVQCHRVDDIARAQWIKFTFLAALAAATCTMRANIGSIVAGEGGADYLAAVHEECCAIAAAEGQPVPAEERALARQRLTQPGSPTTASMLRDLQAGAPVEALQIVGDLVHRAAGHGIAVPYLQAAWVHLQAYQASQGRP
ncbi:MAG: 2-dehydropantoate 2-reductase [Pseudoxanthomonas sp.]